MSNLTLAQIENALKAAGYSVARVQSVAFAGGATYRVVYINTDGMQQSGLAVVSLVAGQLVSSF